MKVVIKMRTLLSLNDLESSRNFFRFGVNVTALWNQQHRMNSEQNLMPPTDANLINRSEKERKKNAHTMISIQSLFGDVDLNKHEYICDGGNGDNGGGGNVGGARIYCDMAHHGTVTVQI